MNISLLDKIFYGVQAFFSKWTLLIPLAVWAIWVQTIYRVPSEFVFILVPWVGVGLTILEVIFLTNTFLSKSHEDGEVRQLLHRVGQWGHYALLMFIFYSAVVYINGQGNQERPISHKSVIRTIAEVPDDWLRYVPYAWFELQSWEDPEKTVRIFWEPDVDGHLYPGQPVLVQLQRGRLGIHWVKEVVADKKAHAHRVLKISPTAAGAWQELVDYYLETHQWDKALKTAQHYMTLFPQDLGQARAWVVALFVARQWRHSLALAEPYVDSPQGYHLATHYGWVLGQGGTPEEVDRAVAVLRAAMAREPHRWEAPFDLGFILSWNGRYQEALEAFEYLQTLRPGSSDVIVEMDKLRKRLAAQSPSPPKSVSNKARASKTPDGKKL